MVSKQISVLIIEDKEHLRSILEYNLRMDGFDVYLAEDGRKGLELARDKKPDVILFAREKIPDVILSDWMTPETDGLEVLSELKADERTKNIPVFMLTVKKMSCHVQAAIMEGVRRSEIEALG